MNNKNLEFFIAKNAQQKKPNKFGQRVMCNYRVCNSSLKFEFPELYNWFLS